MAVGGGLVPVVLPGVSNMAGNPPGARLGRDETWRRGVGWGSVRSAKQKQYPVVDVTGDRSKVRCCKEKFRTAPEFLCVKSDSSKMSPLGEEGPNWNSHSSKKASPLINLS